MVNKLYEGRWKVDKRKRLNTKRSYHYRYLLVNIYNDERMWINEKQYAALNNNSLTISKIRTKMIFDEHRGIYKYGLFYKNGYKAIMLFKTKEEAEYMLRRQYKNLCEIRKIIY